MQEKFPRPNNNNNKKSEQFFSEGNKPALCLFIYHEGAGKGTNAVFIF